MVVHWKGRGIALSTQHGQMGDMKVLYISVSCYYLFCLTQVQIDPGFQSSSPLLKLYR